MSSKTSHRPHRHQRPIREWVGRIALGCGAAVLGYQSVAFSIAQMALNSRPTFADSVISYDGRLQAAHAAALLTPEITVAARAQADALSRAALRRDPTAIAAVVTLGAVTLARNDVTAAQRLLVYAQTLSRRNTSTQLWSIEDAVGRGDVTGALRWYDIALRTKPGMSGALYPILAQATRDPAIRQLLINVLAKRPAWSDSFIGYITEQKDDPRSTEAFLTGLRARGVAIPAAAQAAVVNALLEAGDADQAWRYYATIRPGADRTKLRDPQFSVLLDTPTAFDWTMLNDGGISASIERTQGGGALDFSAPASIGGPVLRQIQVLPPGRYRLAGHSDGIDQIAQALPYWRITCSDDGREIGRVTVPNSAVAGGRFEGTVTVPANCPVQTLTLFAQPSDAIGGISGRIDRVTLAVIR